MYYSQGNLDSLMYFAQEAFLSPNLDQLSGSEYTGESITNTNNSSNILKNLKSFLCMSNGTMRSWWWKNQSKIISWHSPFKYIKAVISGSWLKILVIYFLDNVCTIQWWQQKCDAVQRKLSSVIFPRFLGKNYLLPYSFFMAFQLIGL